MNKIPGNVEDVLKENFFDTFLIGWMQALVFNGISDSNAARQLQLFLKLSEDNCPVETMKMRFYRKRILYRNALRGNTLEPDKIDELLNEVKELVDHIKNGASTSN